MATYRMRLGDFAESVCAEQIRAFGWSVEDLNSRKRNFPNVDLKLSRNGKDILVQVKTCRMYRWISAGGVNAGVCDGGPIFNRVVGAPNAAFIICMSPATKTWEGEWPDDWRFFILPTNVAEGAFRKNVDEYFNGTNLDGTPRKKNGACQDFVGPGTLNSKTVSDHREDYLPYEERFDLLLRE